MKRRLLAPTRPDRTIHATVARGPIPIESRRANDPRCASDVARPAAIRRGLVLPKFVGIEVRPTSQPKESSIRAKRSRKALSAAFEIVGKFVRRGFLPEPLPYSQTARAVRQKRRAIPVARVSADLRD